MDKSGNRLLDNKEEIDNLEDYLKTKLPKIELSIPITTFGSVDLEDLMDNIKQFKKVPTADELLRENKRLKSQLEEKDKIIDEAIEYMKEIEFDKTDKYICIREYKEYQELLEILEKR